MHAKKRRQLSGRGGVDAPVVALRERGGPIRALAVADTTRKTLHGAIEKPIVYTDDAVAYDGLAIQSRNRPSQR